MYQLADKLSFIYCDAYVRGYAGIGRQAWLRAKWGFPVRVRVSLAAPKNYGYCRIYKKSTKGRIAFAY